MSSQTLIRIYEVIAIVVFLPVTINAIWCTFKVGKEWILEWLGYKSYTDEEWNRMYKRFWKEWWLHW